MVRRPPTGRAAAILAVLLVVAGLVPAGAADLVESGPDDLRITQISSATVDAGRASVAVNTDDSEWAVVNQSQTSGGVGGDAWFTIVEADGTVGSNVNLTADLDSATRAVRWIDVAWSATSDRYLVTYIADALVDDAFRVFGQFVAEDGTATGSRFQVSGAISADADDWSFPDNDTGGVTVEWDPANDRFLVAYVARNANGVWRLFTRTVTDATTLGTENDIFTGVGDVDAVTADYYASEPDLAHNSRTGNFIVVYDGDLASGNSHHREVYAQELDATGARIGSGPFRVSAHGVDANPEGVFDADDPTVAYNPDRTVDDPDGELLVTWYGDEDSTPNATNSTTGGNNDPDVWSQRLRADGEPFTAQLGTANSVSAPVAPADTPTTRVWTSTPGSHRPDVVYVTGTRSYAVAYTRSANATSPRGREIFLQQVDAATNTNLGPASPITDAENAGGGVAAGANAERSVGAYDPATDQLLVVYQADDELPDDQVEIFGQFVEVDHGPSGVVLTDPCVALDTATATGDLAGPLDGGSEHAVQITGTLPAGQGGAADCAIPTTATGAILTVTAEGPLREGNLRLLPPGAPVLGGVVNFGESLWANTNTVIVPLTASGVAELSVNAGGSTDPAVDVTISTSGYLTTDPSADRIVTTTPCALFDSRDTQGATGTWIGPHAPGSVLDPVAVAPPAGQGAATGCGAPPEATAVLVSLVAVNAEGQGRLTGRATGSTWDEITVPYDATAPKMNNSTLAVLPLDGDGTIEVAVSGSGGTHVRGVLLGHLVAATEPGLLLEPTAACSVHDSRAGSAAPWSGPYLGGESQTVQITGTLSDDQGSGASACAFPTDAAGALVNAVAVNALAEGNLRLSPAGVSPTGGVVNYGALTPKMNNSTTVLVPLSAGGALDVAANGGASGTDAPSTDIRLIVLGLLTPAP